MNNLTIKILLLIPLVFAATLHSYACGAFERWYDDDSRRPLFKYHFYQGDNLKSHSDSQGEENVRLWRDLTEYSIPDSIIVQGLYKTTLDSMTAALNAGDTSNGFLKWIYDHKANDLKEFLLMAKELEELRQNRVSAWYYPSDKSGFDEASNERGQFQAIIEKCNAHHTGRLADRYALQAVRAYMSIGEYQNCVDLYNQTLAKYSDKNLFKRMAKGYIAGCYARLGDKVRADEMFAQLGDFVSLSREDRLEYMASVNPESERFKSELNYYIGYRDSATNMRYYRIADIALKSPKTIHRGDWLYLKAYIENAYRNDTIAALRYVRQALANSFSMPQMRDDARFFKICLSPFNQNSLSDIKWMLDRGGGEWERHIPDLIERKELTKALLLANYDTMHDSLRYDKTGRDWHTWANSGFQMLLSCKADDVVRYKNELNNPTMSLTTFLRHRIRHDSDYLDEIIGTLYLREGNYRMAVKYLVNVSFDYQRQMNIYNGEYLRYDPWCYYYSGDAWYHPWYNYHNDDNDGETEYYEPNVAKSKVRYLDSQVNAKLNFANEMVRLENAITNETDVDKRALARLRYAIGRYNSLNTCWALTQYWLGASNQCYYCDYLNDYGYKFKFVIDTPRELKGLDNWFEQEVEDLFKTMKNPESIAEAHLILRNYRTLAKRFPETKAGKHIASRCDSWNDWL